MAAPHSPNRSTRPRSSPRTGARASIISSRSGSRPGSSSPGTEVKALRQGEGSIAESYATVKGEEVCLINSHIPEYSHGNRLNHEPRRARKLLFKAREIAKLQGAITRQGLTLVPLSIYFNPRGKAKVELALARGKKEHDKRETIKERDWKREQQRLLRHNG